MAKKKSVRQAVLDAAVALVEQTGAGTLTLDAVAARAGVSKGGLLHHFKSKEALLSAMITDVLTNFEAELDQAALDLTAAGDNPYAYQRNQIETYLDRAFSGLGSKNRSAMALFAVAAHQPNLLQPIRDYFRRRSEHTAAHYPEPMLVLALAALADGLWLFDALGIPPFEGKMREQVRREVLRWAHAALDAAQHKTRVPPPDAPVPAPRRKTAPAK
ncbi:MAG TPA: TetR family transcriptional regulator [Nevskiaceae bacterium]|nr:TetR family transcriptional regulator [Nevskiaceae bacterium]